MSLTTALNIAQNSLLNTQRQTSVVSRNISDASNPDYARRTATLSSMAPGARVVEIRRATDQALFTRNMEATSGYLAQSTIVEGLDRLSLSVNGDDNAGSAAVMLGKLSDAMQLYSANPSNRTLAESTIEAARDTVRQLNDGNNEIQAFRTDMDRQIATAVGELNVLLSEFEQTNDEIKAGTKVGRDVNDALDRRDALLKKISEYVAIDTIQRDHNDLMIVTADGTMLFETNPRHVHFEVVVAYDATTTGNRVLVDGVPVTRATGANTTAGGKIAALVQLRDTFATGMQSQLDEVARGLISAFAETDPGDPLNSVAGLFTWTGAPALPADATLTVGLAGDIAINDAFDPTQGGDPELLRDGNTFDYNVDDAASFSDRIIGYIQQLDQSKDYVTVSGAVAAMSLMEYSADAVGWFEAARQGASVGAESKSALMLRVQEALSNKTNVNIDEEMVLMLNLEHSYSASAKLLQTIDTMLQTLLDIR